MVMILALFIVAVLLFIVIPLAGWALWTLISTFIVGLVIGALARLIVPGAQPISILATVLLGLVGSVVGTIIGHAVGVGHVATILLEIGVAAAAVAVFSGPRGRNLPGRRDRMITR